MKRIIIALSVAVLALAACKPEPAQVKILCHRGLCSTGTEFTTDENTLDALRCAQEAGVDGVEFDVHLTVDGQLVIRHDDKIADGLYCQKSSFEDIRAFILPFGHQIPTLHEWLVQAKETPEIFQLIEIKSHPGDKEKEVVRMCLEEVRALDMLDQVGFVSFKASTCDEVLRQEPKARVTLNSSSLHNSMPPAEVKEHGFTGISYNIQVILNHPEWIQEFKDLGIETYFWMCNCTYLRDLAADLGFTWVTSDFRGAIAY